MRAFEDRHESTAAYIDFMRSRCIELAACSSRLARFTTNPNRHASHYVSVMLNQIFGPSGFVNEIIWKRQSSHNDAKQGSKHLGRVHDTLVMYAKSKTYHFKHLYRLISRVRQRSLSPHRGVEWPSLSPADAAFSTIV
jgi:hypothetical protein